MLAPLFCLEERWVVTVLGRLKALQMKLRSRMESFEKEGQGASADDVFLAEYLSGVSKSCLSDVSLAIQRVTQDCPACADCRVDIPRGQLADVPFIEACQGCEPGRNAQAAKQRLPKRYQ